MALMRRWAGIKSCFSSDCEGDGEMAVLDLRHCSLSSVPTDVFKAEPNLEEIYLDANQIRELPRALFGLQNLHVLGLSDNELTVLPSAVSNLVNLREVDISKNGIIDLPESVKNCKSLEQFDASVNPIGKVPDGFTQLLNLTHVYLNDAFLDRLPSNFGRLSKLKVLELRENHLNNLPESMSYFTQLERLDIGSNEFTELPAVVGCLINLKELWMDCNGVKELPPEIGLLRRLLFLDVTKNRLERLPPEIESLQSLTDLYLSNNMLLELLESIGALGNLQTLKVDENHLVELPFTIGRLHKLEELVVSHNELESLPPSIGSLKKLRVLYADENFLEAIPIELGGCTSMTVLSLHDNRLVRIPDDIGRMPNLQVINLSSNRLVCLPYTFRKLTNLKALWLSENQSKPMVPLQSEFDHGTQSHVLTCFMFPQQPPADEVSLQYSEDSGSIPASLLEEQVRLRSSIVFNIDEDDYLARLARFQSPYPKDVKDRVAQYFASRRQHQQETEVTRPAIPPQHRGSHQERHQCRHNQYEQKVRHSQNPSLNTHELQTRQSHQEQPSGKPVMVVLHAAEPIQPPVPLRPQEVCTVDVPWYEDQPQVLDETSEHRQGQQIGVVHPLNINHQETSAVAARQLVAAREESVSSSTLRNMNVEATRSQASTRRSAEERVNGGQMAVEEVTTTQNLPKYHPPPPYTPRDGRPSLASLSEDDRRQSLETQHSFHEEAPSSSSSYWGRPLRGPGSRSSENTPNSERFSELHSFNEEEPSFIQGPLKPPSYYEATNQADRVPLENVVHHVFNSSQLSEHNAVLGNVHRTIQNLPPPQYTTQFEFPPEQVAIPPTEAHLNVGRQPVAVVRPDIISATSHISDEDAQRFENQVRQLQRERALERREMQSMQAQTMVGDNVRSQVSSRPLVRTNSSESHTSDQSVSSSQDDDEPLDNDPSIELHQVEIYKNPNLGFSIGGGVGSSSNPFDPTDKKSIYVTKVQADGPASFGLIPGDRILEVNGISLRRVTHEKAVMFLKHNQVVNLLIARKKDF